MKRATLLVLACLAAPAAAQPAPAGEPAPEPAAPEPPPDPTRELRARLAAMEARVQQLEDQLAASQDDQSWLEERLAALAPLTGKLGGYLDLGAFVTTGNGAGTRSDLAGTYFPEYAGVVPGSWVFMGDPLSTTVNARGDVADTGESRAVVFDPIDSGGKSTFLVNALNLAVFAGLGERAQVNASVDFVPRARDVSDPDGLFVGDYLDVKLAYVEWRPQVPHVDLALTAGKLDSVLGFEYRSIEAPDRIGVTPSLICRYTCGRPIGLKARARFLDERLIVNLAVTNGSHFSEGFDFARETDSNHGKTVATRLSYAPVRGLELGASGAFGAQDQQTDDGVHQWHVGGDVHLERGDLEVTAELVRGKAEGATSPGGVACDLAPCLRYWGGYLLAAYRLTNTFVPYLRADSRDALHRAGASFVYVSTSARLTVGLRLELGTHAILKVEGTLNREVDLDDETRIPVIPNDVLTSSLVVRY